MTLTRDEDSALRHWSARLIQALQILDLEVDHDKIVQVAVTLLDSRGVVERSWSTLVDPGRDPGPTDVHGITAVLDRQHLRRGGDGELVDR